MYGDITFTQYCSLFRRASHQLSLQYLSFGDKNWEYSLLIHERKIYPSKISMAKNKPVKCSSDIIQKCWWLILCRTNYESRQCCAIGEVGWVSIWFVSQYTLNMTISLLTLGRASKNMLLNMENQLLLILVSRGGSRIWSLNIWICLWCDNHSICISNMICFKYSFLNTILYISSSLIQYWSKKKHIWKNFFRGARARCDPSKYALGIQAWA